MPIYTGFISSCSNLEAERETLIDSLMDLGIYSYAMEHFSVSTHDGLIDLYRLIDNSDFFFLLLGKDFGSVDRRTGKSYTQLEYEYCKEHFEENNARILAFQLPELTQIIEKYSDEMSDLEVQKLDESQPVASIRKQIAFARSFSSSMLKPVEELSDIKDNVVRFINNAKDSGIVRGWVRDIAKTGLPNLKFNREYHQCHLSETDNTYIRIGTVTFSKDRFTGGIVGSGRNTQITYYPERYPSLSCLKRHARDITIWKAHYHLQGNSLVGIYNARKSKPSNFAGHKIQATPRDGIHKLTFNDLNDEFVNYVLSGDFEDAVTTENASIGCKSGRLFVFETEEELLKFLMETWDDVLDNNTEEQQKRRKEEESRKKEHELKQKRMLKNLLQACRIPTDSLSEDEEMFELEEFARWSSQHE